MTTRVGAGGTTLVASQIVSGSLRLTATIPLPVQTSLIVDTEWFRKGYYTGTGVEPSMTLPVGAKTELEFGLELVTADLSGGDTIDLRVYFDDVAFTTYTNTARITFSGPTLGSALFATSLNLIASAVLRTTGSAILPVNLSLAANAVRYTPGSAVGPISLALAANAIRVTPTSAVLAVSMALAANAVRFTTGLASLPVVLNLSVNALRRTTGLASLPIEFGVQANATLFTPNFSAVLPMSVALRADTLWFVLGQYTGTGSTTTMDLGIGGKTELEFGLVLVLGDLSNGDTIDLRVYLDDVALTRYDVTARITAQLAVTSSITFPITMAMSCASVMRMAASAVVPINVSLAASAANRTTGTSVMAVSTSMIASMAQRMAASVAMPIDVGFAADAFIRGKIPASFAADILLSMSSNAFVRRQASAALPAAIDMSAVGVLRTTGQSPMAITTAVVVDVVQRLSARSTFPINTSLSASAFRYSPIAMTAAAVMSMVAGAQTHRPAFASMGIGVNAIMLSKLNLAAYAGMAVSGNLLASASALFAGKSISVIETDLSVDARTQMVAAAAVSGDIAMICEAFVVNFGAPQWITNIDGEVDATLTIQGTATTTDGIEGVARKADLL